MNKTPLTQQQKNEIYEMYCDPTIPLKEIAITYAVDESTASKIARSLGAKPRLPRKSIKNCKKSETYKICPTCKKPIVVQNAKYCYHCGSDVRTAKELLIERIVAIRCKFNLMPENIREELSRLLIDIQTELNKG